MGEATLVLFVDRHQPRPYLGVGRRVFRGELPGDRLDLRARKGRCLS
jgi:hypothetical protein